MVNEYLTRAYDTKVIFRELLCFYAPFGWVPVKENRAPSPNAPIHKMYDGNTVWSMEKQDYVSDYDVGRKRSEKIVVKRNTKFTRNNRLMMEEAVMEYHLRFRYWLYPRCNRLRLINRCRPGWGILWSLLFLIFLFFHLTIAFGAPKAVVNNQSVSNFGTIACEAKEQDIYSLTKTGPFYYVKSGDIYYSRTANGNFTVVDEGVAEVQGVSYNSSNGKLVFTKDAAGEELEAGTRMSIYKTPTGVFATVYNAVTSKIDGWFESIGAGKVFNILCYVLATLFFLLLLYQLQSNWWLKKNTERIIGCCINAKAIVQAMQYEDITLMNGRQRHRYYQGQVINEAMRNTGDPQYFGS